MNGAPGRVVVIVNVSSGWDDKADAPRLVRQILQTRGLECEIVAVHAGADIRRIAADAVRAGAGCVVAGGGDGTLRAAAAGVAGTGAVLGILPVGTLNHFARDMEIPLGLEEAAVVVAEGFTVSVDAGEVNGFLFLNNSVIGLYPAYRFERDARESRGANRWLATLAGMFATIRRYPFLAVRLVADGTGVVRRTPYIMVANNEHAMEGFKPWQRDRMTEGKLCVYLMRDGSRWGLARLILKLVAGRLRAEDEFEVLRASEVTVETRRRIVGVALDGEIFRMETPLRYRSHPLALRVIVPAHSRRVAEVVCERPGGMPFAS